MECLFINTNYRSGGAALAANHLAVGLKSISVDIKWYVKNTKNSIDSVYAFQRRLKDRFSAPLHKSRVTYSPYIKSTRDIAYMDMFRDADILHFHNLHGDFFNYTAIPYLTQIKPAVWTLHDMWSFTGHCIYSKACERWKIGCGSCPDLTEYPAIRYDGTATEWRAKEKAVNRSRLHIVTPSRWLGKLAADSLFKRHPISVIPYGLDTDCFSPRLKSETRRKLGLLESRFTVILCSADLSDPRKPQRILCDAINTLFTEKRLPVQVIAFGNGSVREYLDPDIVLHEFGYITSEINKAELFSSADVFLFASKADNLPLVIQESLSCGTPVIANDVGGISDMVIEGETGWLLPNMDLNSYAKAISVAYNNNELLKTLSSGARNHAVNHYALIESAKKYRDIYEDLLDDK